MEILERYAQALALYKAKNFDAALELVNDIKIAVPHWKKPFLLAAYIRIVDKGSHFGRGNRHPRYY